MKKSQRYFDLVLKGKHVRTPTTIHSLPADTFTVVVTGCSEGGIGASTAISLAHGSPATIFVAGRTLSKVNPAIEAIKAISPSTDAIFVPLDLGEFDSIRAAAKLVLESGKAEEIHGLINNAGVMAVVSIPPYLILVYVSPNIHESKGTN